MDFDIRNCLNSNIIPGQNNGGNVLTASTSLILALPVFENVFRNYILPKTIQNLFSTKKIKWLDQHFLFNYSYLLEGQSQTIKGQN